MSTQIVTLTNSKLQTKKQIENKQKTTTKTTHIQTTKQKRQRTNDRADRILKLAFMHFMQELI